MPCWRQSAAVAIPASCSLSTPTICSCVNRLPRIPSSLGHMPIEDSHYPSTSFRGAGQDLELLGLKVHLDKVVLDITAQSGPGNLLGNLLCAIANLLNNPGGALNQLVDILNR